MTADVASRLNDALSDRYRIEHELGEGGMATVYLAHDLKHNRRVALKVLRPELAAMVGPERFLAEIETTANLQHPHILPLFDSGEADGFLFFVMPYVEGETLRDKLEREQQLPVEEALAIIGKVAAALDHAHRHGVIHRDIKPGNILLSAEGEPMVADFGIALAVAQAGGGRVTETGLSLGTPHYMSPEQAAGDRGIGPRSDVYASACVLYEMLVGEPPFTGPNAQALLAQIIAAQPRPPVEKRATIPLNVDAAIRRALEKLPADRFATAGALVAALADQGFRYGEEAASRTEVSAPARSRAIVAAAAVAVVAFTLGWLLHRPGVEPDAGLRGPVRFTLPVPGGYEVTFSNEVPSLAVSPDGTVVVYRENGVLMRRSLEEEEAEPIPGTEGAQVPFFSPDGQQLGFLQDGAFRVIRLADGATRTVSGTSVDRAHGADWGEDDNIVYSREVEGIWSLPVQGGEAEQITDPGRFEDETTHMWPQSLANGRLLLYSAIGPSGKWHDSKIVLENLETGRRSVVVERGAHGRYVPSGHVVYANGNGEIVAVPFDVDRGSAGDPIQVASDVLLGTWGAGASFDVSLSGTLVFARGSAWERYLLYRYDRSGRRLSQLGPAFTGLGLEVEPGGARIATSLSRNQNDDVFLIEEGAVNPQRITFAPESEGWPLWSPDASRIAWQREVGGGGQVLVREVDRQAEVDTVFDSGSQVWTNSWSPDGRWLTIQIRGERGFEIVAVDMDDYSNVIPFWSDPVYAGASQFSPDGRWIAFLTEESSERQLQVASFPDAEGATLVSHTDHFARWSPDTNELFFWQDTTLMAATYRTDPRFVVESVREVFTEPDYAGGGSYDVTPDGFLIMVHNRASWVREIQVVLNLPEIPSETPR